MVNQTTMNGRTSTKNDGRSLKHDAAGLAQDVLELSELQFSLLVTDLRAATASLRTAGLLVIIALALAIAAAPVLLLALAEALQAGFNWSPAVSLLVAGLAGLAVSAGALGAGWTILRAGLAKFGRSREEFAQNLAWAKQTLAGSASSGPAATPEPTHAANGIRPTDIT